MQAFNDFLVFGMMAVGSFSSGQLLANYGWSAVNLVVFPPVLLGLAVLAAASLARRRAHCSKFHSFPNQHLIGWHLVQANVGGSPPTSRSYTSAIVEALIPMIC